MRRIHSRTLNAAALAALLVLVPFTSTGVAQAQVEAPVSFEVLSLAATSAFTSSVPKLKKSELKVGSKAKIRVGKWAKGAKLKYAWFVSGKKVSSKKSYRFSVSQGGFTVKVTVTGKLKGYPKKITTKSATYYVVGTVKGSTPKVTVAPQAGVVSTIVAGSGWTKGSKLAYGWYVNGTKVSSAKSYRFTSAQTGKTAAVKVTGTKSHFTSTVKSSKGLTVKPATVPADPSTPAIPAAACAPFGISSGTNSGYAANYAPVQTYLLGMINNYRDYSSINPAYTGDAPSNDFSQCISEWYAKVGTTTDEGKLAAFEAVSGKTVLHTATTTQDVGRSSVGACNVPFSSGAFAFLQSVNPDSLLKRASNSPLYLGVGVAQNPTTCKVTWHFMASV